MTTSFADYCATSDARDQIAANVLEWTQMLCLSLEQNFVNESIRRAHFFSASGDNTEYWENRIAEYKEGKDLYKFTINTGRKYHKIIMIDTSGSESVHAFVDKKTGELYKAASFKAPAKGVRFDLRIIKEREFVLENADWAGGYLYK
jgi:hypothetical protein|tara:strand:- start:7060 stop:7500 length:441 start_codon:yes stop_codon:yes gene_type:complete